MKKLLILCFALILSAFAFTGCFSSESTDNQGNGTADSSTTQKGNLGDYNVIIDSCRLTNDYQGNPAIIVKYIFTNYDDEPSSFFSSVYDTVFQNGISLDHTSITDSNDNEYKQIKTGITLSVEVAYELADTVNDIEIEVTEYAIFTNYKVTKTFSIK